MVGEQLACHIAQRQSPAIGFLKTANNFFYQPKRFLVLNFILYKRKKARVSGASFIIHSATEEEKTGRIIVVRLAEVAPVVKVEVVIIGLEVKRVIRRLPKICLLPPAITERA